MPLHPHWSTRVEKDGHMFGLNLRLGTRPDALDMQQQKGRQAGAESQTATPMSELLPSHVRVLRATGRSDQPAGTCNCWAQTATKKQAGAICSARKSADRIAHTASGNSLPPEGGDCPCHIDTVGGSKTCVLCEAGTSSWLQLQPCCYAYASLASSKTSCLAEVQYRSVGRAAIRTASLLFPVPCGVKGSCAKLVEVRAELCTSSCPDGGVGFTQSRGSPCGPSWSASTCLHHALLAAPGVSGSH